MRFDTSTITQYLKPYNNITVKEYENNITVDINGKVLIVTYSKRNLDNIIDKLKMLNYTYRIERVKMPKPKNPEIIFFDEPTVHDNMFQWVNLNKTSVDFKKYITKPFKKAHKEFEERYLGKFVGDQEDEKR